MQRASLEFLVFALIGIVGLGLNEGIMRLVSEVVEFQYLPAK